MTAELLVYALLAAALIFWLRSILGTRSEDDPKANIVKLELNNEGKVIAIGPEGISEGEDRYAQIEELINSDRGNMSIENTGVRDTLLEIAKMDGEFNIHKFLQATQDVFVYVVESFADGDRDTLSDLLSPQVYEAFNRAITEREEAGDVMSTEIQSIKKSAITEARLEGSGAFITIRFLAEEITYTKDKEENLVQGHPDKVTQMRDMWTFFRDLKSKDPRWLVVETKEDGDMDNDTIPNSV